MTDVFSSFCEGGVIDCGDVDCSQVASCDVEGMTYEVGMRYCGKRCDDRLTTSCDDDTALVDGCFCRNGTYENHIVSPTFFPYIKTLLCFVYACFVFRANV